MSFQENINHKPTIYSSNSLMTVELKMYSSYIFARGFLISAQTGMFKNFFASLGFLNCLNIDISS